MYLNELSLQPIVILDCFIDWHLAVLLHIGMGHIRELGGGVVTPDDRVLNLVSRHTHTCGDLFKRIHK